MKKTSPTSASRHLTLNRETLLLLDEPTLGKARGGGIPQSLTDCASCISKDGC